MKLWKLTAPHTISLEQSEPTSLTEQNNIKIRIEQVLLGKYDLALSNGVAKGKYPVVLGKNAVGVVSETLNEHESPFQKMNRVVVEPFIPCGQCPQCLEGSFTKCANLLELGYNEDGMLRDFVDLPEGCCHKIPDILSDEKALFVPYVAFCLNILDSLDIPKGTHVAVFSSSKIGIIASQLLKYYQCVPIFVSNDEEALKAAKELGIFYAFNTETDDVKHEVLVATGGRLCDKVIYFANSLYSIKDVLDCCAFNASICIGGYNTVAGNFPITKITQKHLNISGIYNGCGNYPSAINLVATNKVNVENLIEKTISFDNLDQELQSLESTDLGYKSLLVKVD